MIRNAAVVMVPYALTPVSASPRVSHCVYDEHSDDDIEECYSHIDSSPQKQYDSLVVSEDRRVHSLRLDKPSA